MTQIDVRRTIKSMKMYIGFQIDGPEVRWIPPSPARGRPFGFWERAYGGGWIHGIYDKPTLWIGGPGGISRIARCGRDANGKPLYCFCGGPSWSGEQKGNKAQGDDHWEDRWLTGRESPDGVTTPDGYKLVIWEGFDTSWLGYLSSVEDGMYAERRDVAAGIVKPYIDEPGCVPIIFTAAYG